MPPAMIAGPTMKKSSLRWQCWQAMYFLLDLARSTRGMGETETPDLAEQIYSLARRGQPIYLAANPDVRERMRERIRNGRTEEEAFEAEAEGLNPLAVLEELRTIRDRLNVLLGEEE